MFVLAQEKDDSAACPLRGSATRRGLAHVRLFLWHDVKCHRSDRVPAVCMWTRADPGRCQNAGVGHAWTSWARQCC